VLARGRQALDLVEGGMRRAEQVDRRVVDVDQDRVVASAAAA